MATKFDYGPIVQLAKDMILQFGRPCTFLSYDSQPSSATPWKGDGAVTISTQTVDGCFVPASGSDFGEGWLSPDLLARVEKVVLVAPNDLNLQEYTAVSEEDDDTTWRIEWVSVLRPGPVVCLYAFGINR